MKRRLFSLFVSMAILVAGLTGCASSPQNKAESEWLQSAALNARETPQQLYQAALGEDVLVIYSNTTRIYDTQKAFEAAYPGLTADVQFLRAADLVSLLRENAQTGEALCDVVICTDNDAILSTQMVPEGLLHKYVPWDMEDKILPQYNTEVLDFMVECGLLFYNSEVYRAPPIANWWELTEPQYSGKFYMVDPLRSHTTNALLFTFIQHSDAMAAAYEDLYGKALQVPAGSTAGHEFWRMLVANGAQFTSSSDEALELVGMPGQSDPPMAILVSSKDRKADLGYAIAPAYDVAPTAGVVVPSSVMIHGGATNVNAAKLFIRFLLGEADGRGEGLAPYMHEGSWPVRSDVTSPSAVQLEDVDFWLLDKRFMAENLQDITEYWVGLRQGG
ncbi:ABC transporter substrate-binding protein [Clostridia bacterium OttesenSCG-928-O13]|nr:ABC transporter substrate-binding protein [Clostridia bacterium OttesenSCG-928-O13]